jgi:hypothetical protein
MIKIFFFTLAIAFVTAQTSDPRCMVPSEFAIVFPHPTDCTKFMKCFGSIPTEMDCPWQNAQQTARLHFSPRDLVCEWPHLAGCAAGFKKEFMQPRKF